MSWRRFFRRGAGDRRRREEFDAHVDMYIDQLVARGHTPDEARRDARLKFGNPRSRREEIADMNRLPLFDTLTRDVAYAFRIMRRSPAFALTAIATLAVVIGANSAVFSLANSILFKPLPYPEPDRLASIDLGWRASTRPLEDSIDGAMWETLRARATTLDVGAFSSAGGANFVTGSMASYIHQQRVSAGYFHALGVAPLVGREFSPDEDVAGGPAVTVISYDMWQRAFGGRPDAVGQTMRLKGEAYVVVGIMPAGFVSIADVDVWTPLHPSSKGEGGGTNYGAIARLKPGVTWDAAQQQLASFDANTFRLLGPDGQVGAYLTVDPLQDDLVQNDREPLAMLGAAVAAVLVIACVNIAALLLSRGGGRAKEIATRMALGSGRAAVVRQLLVESLVLAVIGGAAGLLVGALGLDVLKTLGGETFENWTRATLDGRVIALMAGLSVLTSLFFGLIPAWQASRLDVNATLQAGGSRSVAGGSRRWSRKILVVAEVALGVALLVTTGLLLRTFLEVRGLDPGINPAGVVTATASLQDARYQSGANASRLFNDTLDRLSHDPDIASAGVALCAPFQRLLNMGFRFTDLPPDKGGRGANVSYVAGDYFQTLQVPLRAGRFLTATDDALSPKVVVVSEVFAKGVSDDKPVLGRWLQLAGSARQVVGVVGNILQLPAGAVGGVTGVDKSSPLTPTAAIYVPAAQAGDGLMSVHIWFSPVWVVRSRTPAAGEAALRRAITMADPLLPIAKVETMNAITLRAIGDKRLLMTIIAALSVAALFLSALGIHGLIAQQVSERRREFGIRIALGASPIQTVRQVAFGGIWLSVAGVVLGLGLASLTANLVKSFLWHVDTSDPATYIGAAAFLLVVASVASLLPALRILRLNPAVTLRD